MLKVSQEGAVTLFYMGRSPMGFLLYPVYAFLAGDTLIDTGTGRARRPFLRALQGRGVGKIVNTHHHEDHTGNNRAVHEMFEAPIYAHQKALPYLADPGLNRLRPYQRIVWAYPEPAEGEPVGAEIQAGAFRFRVMETPGHTDDHICLYEPERRWLFSGDLFCGTGFVYLRSDENYLRILSTLKELAKLEIDTIFCSLKGAVNDGHNALARKIARMEDIRDRVLDLHAKGMPRVRIKKEIFGNEDSWNLITCGHYSKQNTIDGIIGGKRPDQGVV